MVAKTVTPTEEQSAAHEALAATIAEAAERVLAGYSDEQLLAKPQARWVTLVKSAVRSALREQHPFLLERVSAWQLGRLLTEHLRNAVRASQFEAFERQLTAIYGPLDEGGLQEELPIWGPINGVYVVEVHAPTFEIAERDKSWSADDELRRAGQSCSTPVLSSPTSLATGLCGINPTPLRLPITR
jgi:hypothetical protein